MTKAATNTDLARLLQTFFCQRLMQERQASPQTINAYRDTFRLLLRFAEAHAGKSVAQLSLADLNARLVLDFLDNLETCRHNKVRSRNARLAAIRAFVHYAMLEEPTLVATMQQVLAIPTKCFDRSLIGYLTRPEMEAILQAPDEHSWSGQRDRALLTTLYNSGARVSEILAARRIDLEGENYQALHLHGKGRKERTVPLWKRTSKLLREWLLRIGPTPQQPLFPNRFNQPMTRSGVASRLRQAVQVATPLCPSLKDKTVSPHTVRHATAMHLLQSGVDITVIALWLGHESVETTHQYLEADMKMKERALAALQPPTLATARFKPSSGLLAFLDSL